MILSDRERGVVTGIERGDCLVLAQRKTFQTGGVYGQLKLSWGGHWD